MSNPDVRAAVDDLRNTGKAVLADDRFKAVFEEHRAFSESDLDDYESEVRQEKGMETFGIGPELRELFRATGGIRFQWQFLTHAKAGRVTTGSAKIVNVLDLYRTEEEHRQPFAQIYDQHRPFDQISATEFVGLKFARPDGSVTGLAYVNSNRRPVALPVDVPNYLTALAASRAMYGWQRAHWGIGPTGAAGGSVEDLRNALSELFSGSPA